MEHTPDLALLQKALEDKVENLSYLDAGGFKAVYKGSVQGHTEAIKVVYIPSYVNGDDERDEIIGRVRREIESLNKFTCPQIVHLGTLLPKLFEIDSREYIIYSEEFLDGKSLRTKLRERYKPNLLELVQLSTSLLKAVQVLKANDLIHRDIKPDNVIALKCSERPFVILDLGIAFKLHGTALTRNQMYRPGTLPYMAPEMFNPRFRETLDYRSDIYSVGITIYEYASGKHPIRKRGEDNYTTMYRIINIPPTPLSTNRPDLLPEFCTIIDQLIKKLPALRPASIDLLLKKLKELS